ncbi:glycosyltransferase [uncultured Lacinutrix sp.]|uniref:glycosyltransferase n=1 Tax=uncultured Lacinutrix sp. TaxID=574032 RepID=UPI00260833B3|nr:glycosyltransferase [uncultured Lacinutrix sp.]
MRVLQLIDSLQTGGAERVAVNIANALTSNIETSYLCATREEGLLKESIDTRVNYLFLNKKKTIEFKAIKNLNSFVKHNKINVIHAHSTSFFLATIIKILNKNVKIVWHDHYGNSTFLEARSYKMLKKCSKYFSVIYSVNKELEVWARETLNSTKVSYLPNFAVINIIEGRTTLKGKENKRIIHLANLREQKDHFTLLKAFKGIVSQFPEWTLHCVGKDFEDDYSKAFKQEIKTLRLEENVFVYGSKPDITHILNQAEIAVLSSKSEGLPIALLEYGLASLPTIATNVGNCNLVIANETLGQLVPSINALALSQAIINYISDMENARIKGANFKTHVQANFSANSVAKTLVEDYKRILE